jgi:hypothetical protein
VRLLVVVASCWKDLETYYQVAFFFSLKVGDFQSNLLACNRRINGLRLNMNRLNRSGINRSGTDLRSKSTGAIVRNK